MNNVVNYLRKTATEYPDKLAFSDSSNSITFAELERRAGALGNKIIAKTNGAFNKPIAVFMHKTVETIVAFFAVIMSGNYYSPIDVKMPQSRIKMICNVLKPVAVVTDELYEIDDAISIQYEDIQTKYDERAINNQLAKVLSVDPIYVLFTSGSTGIPKGVVISHAGVIDYVEWVIRTFEFNDTTVFGNQAPFFFDNSVLDIYTTIFTGARMEIIDERMFTFPQELMDYMNQRNVNTVFWVPSALIGVANSGVLERSGNLPKLERILFAGEVMPAKQLRIWRKHFPDAMFVNLYGPTEITVDCTYYVVNRDYDDSESIPIGKACENTEILLLTEENKLADCGEIAEICVRGIGVSKGYYGNVEKTKDVFIQNPLNSAYIDMIYKTGDLAKYDEKGNIIFIGRSDSQVKIQGHRIELGEIEVVASNIEGISRTCAVVSSEQKICLILEVMVRVEPKSIYRALKENLPRYMLPSSILQCYSMPLNENGKIDRQLLRREVDEENSGRFIS